MSNEAKSMFRQTLSPMAAKQYSLKLNDGSDSNANDTEEGETKHSRNLACLRKLFTESSSKGDDLIKKLTVPMPG